MHKVALSAIMLLGLIANAQVATVELSPGQMKWLGYAFSVQPKPLTNATEFTLTISSMKAPISEGQYATLRTEPEPAFTTNWIDDHMVLIRNKMKDGKSEAITNCSVASSGNSIVYSFAVPNEKLDHATFFWRPQTNVITETCCRIALKPFVK